MKKCLSITICLLMLVLTGCSDSAAKKEEHAVELASDYIDRISNNDDAGCDLYSSYDSNSKVFTVYYTIDERYLYQLARSNGYNSDTETRFFIKVMTNQITQQNLPSVMSFVQKTYFDELGITSQLVRG